MNQTVPPTEFEAAKTVGSPKASAMALRYAAPADLYASVPLLSELTQIRPEQDETQAAYLTRLHTSDTPEEAITFTSFVLVPQLAIWWAHECLRLMPETLNPDDIPLLEQIGQWVGDPSKAARHAIMKNALFAPKRTPAVMLGLATGWSGGSIAPNDPAPVPMHRAPKMVNSAVLSALAKAQLASRQLYMSNAISLAKAAFES